MMFFSQHSFSHPFMHQTVLEHILYSKNSDNDGTIIAMTMVVVGMY